MTLLRQSFDAFLNAPGPSTPRGGGRGGRGRGRGGGKGGGQALGSGHGGGSNLRKSDYSNVPFDYATINNQRYNKMDGYVQPFGPTSTDSPRGRGSQTPRGGRGRGRGGTLANTASPGQPDSGQSTPVTGLGHRGRGRGRGRGGGLGFGSNDSPAYKSRSTVGREGVTWGGRGAPLFVKGGELFKDGEVDVIKKDEDDSITVKRLPLSDPSAPQMTDLTDDTEIEIRDTEAVAAKDPPDSLQPAVGSGDDLDAAPVSLDDSAEVTEEMLEASVAVEAEEAPADQLAEDMSALSASDVPTEAIAIEEESAFYVDTAPQPVVDVEVEEEMFFVDTAPAAAVDVDDNQKPTYRTESKRAIGQQSRKPVINEQDEEIVFAPKTYKQPRPIVVDMQQPSSSRRRLSSPRPVITQSAPAPKGPSRSQKKAAKREKRKGKKLKRTRRQAELAVGSDVSWGSDGPPGGDILEVEGMDQSDGEDDVAVLRDYLAGTLLNERAAPAGDEDNDEAESESAESEEEGELDSDEVDEAIDIDMMKQFGDGVSKWSEPGQRADSDDESDEDEVEDDEDDEDEDADSQDFDMDEESDYESGSSSNSDDGDGINYEMEEDIDRQLALALEKGGEEDSEMEELFTGKAGWSDDTDWFIQSMEDALNSKASTFKNKNRKGQSDLFHAIENGNFDDLDLPTEPAKKNKNKHVPAQLQAQWEKDRLAKAEKKRQRALDRLIAEIDPYPSARTKKGKMKLKGKGKGKGQDTVTAASLAHLIPASASQVAEMFDISSGEELDINDRAGGSGRRHRSGRGMGLLPDVTESWMAQLNDQIREFLADNGKQTFSLPPMDGEGRKKIHMLAECYGLGSKSRGGGRARFTILIKNSRSGQVIDHDQIDRLVEASSFTGGLFYKNFFGGGGGKLKMKGHKADKGKGKAGGGGPSRQPMPSLRARDGEQVGGAAERIGMDNIGHQLLSKMGWAEGDRIGRGAGLEAPIVAIVKNTKSGLGA